MTTRPQYPNASSSTSLTGRERNPVRVDLTSASDDYEEYDPTKYYHEAGNVYRSQSPASNYLSPLPNAPKLGASASNISLTNDTDEDTERGFNTNGGWAAPPAPRRRSVFLEALFPDSLACRAYLIVVLTETFLDLVIESIILFRVNRQLENTHDPGDESPTLARSRIPVYLSIFGLAHIFQFLLALDAVYHKNTLQFAFLNVFNALFILYGVIQIFEVQVMVGLTSAGFLSTRALMVLIPIVVSIAEVAYIGLAWKIYNEFGWQVFKFLGADRKIKRMYAQYQIFECLMRFDVFFWAGFSIQLISLVLAKGDFEFYLTIAALPLSLLLIFEGHLAARHESRWMMGIFGFGCFAAMVYFVYKTFRIIHQKHSDTFKEVWKTLIVFALISIVLLILTTIWGVMVFRNFGSGLRHHLNKGSEEKAREREELELGSKGTPGALGRLPPSSNNNRLSIE